MMAVNQFSSKGLAVPSRLARSKQLPIVSRCPVGLGVSVSAASLQGPYDVSSLVPTL